MNAVGFSRKFGMSVRELRLSASRMFNSRRQCILQYKSNAYLQLSTTSITPKRQFSLLRLLVIQQLISKKMWLICRVHCIPIVEFTLSFFYTITSS